LLLRREQEGGSCVDGRGVVVLLEATVEAVPPPLKKTVGCEWWHDAGGRCGMLGLLGR
jgi:hypothetical protein